MISDYLKRYFQKKGISQYQIAKETNIAQPKINLIFNGKRKLTADELIRIAIVFDLDLNQIKETIFR